MKQRTKKSIVKVLKWLGTAIFAIPTLAAILEMVMFGLTFDNAVLKPFIKPFVACKNIFGLDEGGYSQYKTTVTVKRPLYLFLTKRISQPYTLVLNGLNGYTFSSLVLSQASDNAILVEMRYSSQDSISKSVLIAHRFINKDSYQFDLVSSGPTRLLEEECPFEYLSQY